MTKCKCELDGCTALCSCLCHDEKYELLDDDSIVIRKFDDDGAMPLKCLDDEINEVAVMTEEICTCEKTPVPEGASIEKYLCADCGKVAIGWYWESIQLK